MLGFVREWCANVLPAGRCRNHICGWSHYCTNYDCNIAFTVAGETAAEGARFPFRLVLSAAASHGAQGRR
jgi:hypothetical protein